MIKAPFVSLHFPLLQNWFSAQSAHLLARLSGEESERWIWIQSVDAGQHDAHEGDLEHDAIRLCVRKVFTNMKTEDEVHSLSQANDERNESRWPRWTAEGSRWGRQTGRFETENLGFVQRTKSHRYLNWNSPPKHVKGSNHFESLQRALPTSWSTTCGSPAFRSSGRSSTISSAPHSPTSSTSRSETSRSTTTSRSRLKHAGRFLKQIGGLKGVFISQFVNKCACLTLIIGIPKIKTKTRVNEIDLTCFLFSSFSFCIRNNHRKVSKRWGFERFRQFVKTISEPSRWAPIRAHVWHFSVIFFFKLNFSRSLKLWRAGKIWGKKLKHENCSV